MLLLNYLPEIILGQLLLVSIIGNIWLLNAYKNVTKNSSEVAAENIQALIVETIADDLDPTLLAPQPVFKTEADPLLDNPIVIEATAINEIMNPAVKPPRDEENRQLKDNSAALSTEIETPQGTITLFATELVQAQPTETTAIQNTDQNIKELLDQINKIEEQLKIKSETTA